MNNRRMKREMELLSRGGPAPGISAWPREEGARLDVLDAEITGAADTPYQGGLFRLELNIPAEYPLKPPRVRFVTPIYHPNIDSQGRICLDTLNMPPAGAWKPSLNISTLLTTIQALMSSPNPDDGLMLDITEEFRRNPALFRNKARDYTIKHAIANPLSAQPSSATQLAQSAQPASFSNPPAPTSDHPPTPRSPPPAVPDTPPPTSTLPPSTSHSHANQRDDDDDEITAVPARAQPASSSSNPPAPASDHPPTPRSPLPVVPETPPPTSIPPPPTSRSPGNQRHNDNDEITPAPAPAPGRSRLGRLKKKPRLHYKVNTR